MGLYIKLVDGVEVEMTPEEIAERQAEERAAANPVKSLGDTLRDFLFASLEANIDLIDPVTEVRIRQLQKTLESLPYAMGDLRFAQGVRPIIAGFEIPDIPTMQADKATMLAKIDEVIENGK